MRMFQIFTISMGSDIATYFGIRGGDDEARNKVVYLVFNYEFSRLLSISN